MLALLLLAIAQNRADDVADLILALSLTTTRSDQAAFVHEIRRKLPRYHWRPLVGIRAGEALADLQRIALRYEIRLPTSFALVGKTLAQADSIARALDPQLDPIALMEQDALEVMAREVERRLEPNALLAQIYTQVEPLLRMPRRVGHIVSELEHGTLKVGIEPTGLEELEHALRSVANRVGASFIIVGLLIASALLASTNEVAGADGLLGRRRARPLHALEDLPHARRALGPDALELDERDPRARAQAQQQADDLGAVLGAEQSSRLPG